MRLAVNAENYFFEQNNLQLRALLDSLDLHIPGEAGHAERVAVYAVACADAMGFSDEQIVDLRRAAKLHDIGKMSLDSDLFTKFGSLTDVEVQRIRTHVHGATQFLSEFPWLAPALSIIEDHHERWDGTGYPCEKSGEDIHPSARIIAVCEAFDQMVTDSSYRRTFEPEEALAEIQRCSGSQFDPAVVQVFCEVQKVVHPFSL